MKHNIRNLINILKENTEQIKVGDKVIYSANKNFKEGINTIVSKVLGNKVEIEDIDGEKIMVDMSNILNISNGRDVNN